MLIKKSVFAMKRHLGIFIRLKFDIKVESFTFPCYFHDMFLLTALAFFIDDRSDDKANLLWLTIQSRRSNSAEHMR